MAGFGVRWRSALDNLPLLVIVPIVFRTRGQELRPLIDRVLYPVTEGLDRQVRRVAER